ncbi:MAG: hypothetical protein OEQ39_23775 [Gammaproteobacteria bacterium]|nr:hypothetical protein [Gammaproteobacteria bacterium]
MKVPTNLFAVETCDLGGVRVRRLFDALQAKWTSVEQMGHVSKWTIVAIESSMEEAVDKSKVARELMRKKSSDNDPRKYNDTSKQKK